MQAVSIAVLAVVLAVTLPHSFFESWGWLAGPAAWTACALLVARVLRLPVAGVLIGAALAGIPAIIAVLTGEHWLGTALGIPRVRDLVRAAGARPRAARRGRLGAPARVASGHGPRPRREDRARHGRVAGHREGDRGRARARGRRGWRSAPARAERIEAAAAEIGATGLVHDTVDVDATPRLVAAAQEALGGRARRRRHEHGRTARRPRSTRLRSRGVGGRLPDAGAGPAASSSRSSSPGCASAAGAVS